MTTFNCEHIRQTMQSGAILLDVRSVDEFSRGALPNAQNIPLALLPVVAGERLGNNKPVLVYCQVGSRAHMAEKILTRLGFTDVTNIGGIQQYQNCN